MTKAAAERLAQEMEDAGQLSPGADNETLNAIIQPFLEAYAKEVREEERGRDWHYSRDQLRAQIAAWHRERAEFAKEQARVALAEHRDNDWGGWSA